MKFTLKKTALILAAAGSIVALNASAQMVNLRAVTPEAVSANDSRVQNTGVAGAEARAMDVIGKFRNLGVTTVNKTNPPPEKFFWLASQHGGVSVTGHTYIEEEEALKLLEELNTLHALEKQTGVPNPNFGNRLNITYIIVVEQDPAGGAAQAKPHFYIAGPDGQPFNEITLWDVGSHQYGALKAKFTANNFQYLYADDATRSIKLRSPVAVKAG